MKREFPYIVVRLMATVYQREDIDFRVGEPAAEIHARRSFVQHPEPFNADGSLTEGCRQLLVDTLLAASVRLRFRMCVVWEADSSTYAEPDGSVVHRRGRPTGGVGSGGVGGTPLPISVGLEGERVPYASVPASEEASSAGR